MLCITHEYLNYEAISVDSGVVVPLSGALTGAGAQVQYQRFGGKNSGSQPQPVLHDAI